jgi:DNA-binding NtrC family response regulator
MAGHLLIVDDEISLRENLKTFLERNEYTVVTAGDGKEALDIIETQDFDAVLSDIRMPEIDGLELAKTLSGIRPDTPLILMTAFGSVETAVEALHLGVTDYILKPIKFDDLLRKVTHLVQFQKLRAENQQLRRELEQKFHFDNIIGESSSLKEIFEVIGRVSNTKSTVLVTGESGTGKELIARAIHYSGERKKRIFVPINCAAIPENLLESELFGHVRGSFTGAVQDKEGLFKVADKGTLFLDEISELSLGLQVKLLRAIEMKEFLPVGARSPLTVDVRFVAASNRDLAQAVEEGLFREDLYYRLTVLQIDVPPLRDRRDDIPLLVTHFIKQMNKELKKNIRGVTNDTMKTLLAHAWRGNVRELINAIERAMIYCDGETIERHQLPMTITNSHADTEEVSEELKEAMQFYEYRHITRVLDVCGGDKKIAAGRLGIGVSSLFRKLKELKPV